MRTSTIQPPLGMPLNLSHPLSRGLIGCWPMNEGGGTLSRDIINSNNGTLTNGAVFKQTAKGNAISFDSLNDYLNLSKNNLAPGSGSWSWSGFARSAGVVGSTQYMYWDSLDNAGNFPLVAIGLLEATPSLFTVIRDTTNQISLTTIAITYGVWYHFAATYNQGTKTWTQYINGVNVLSGTNALMGSIDTNSAGLPIMGAGKGSGALANYWNGFLTNIFIYSRCLLPNEVKQLYTNPYQMYIGKK